MNLDDIFIINGEEKFDFLANRETGRWVLVKKGHSWKKDENLLRYLNKKFVRKPYQGIDLIVINTTQKCNFRCKYCYIGDIKEEERDMDTELGKIIVDNALNMKQKEITFVFHGSEPTLNFKFIKEVVKYGRKKEKECNKILNFSIQSNGSILTKEILRFIRKYNVKFSLSLDGVEETHNKVRIFKNGNPTYSIVLSNIEKLVSIQNIHLITVITKYNVNRLAEFLEHYQKLGVSQILFSPVIPFKDAKNLMPSNSELIEGISILFDKTLEKIIKNEMTIRLRNFIEPLSNFFEEKFTETCLKCTGGMNQPLVAIDIDGSIYPCDNFWRVNKFKIGNVRDISLEETLNSHKNFRKYRNIKKIKGCNKCDWMRFCGGGCPGESYSIYNTINHKSIYCEYYNFIFKYFAEKLAMFYNRGILEKILGSNFPSKRKFKC